MRDWNIRSLRIIRTVADLGLMVLLAWGATVGINHIYGLGGRREVTQRLNPVLVQTYDPIPPGAQPYFSFKSRNILGEVVIVVHEGTIKIERPE